MRFSSHTQSSRFNTSHLYLVPEIKRQRSGRTAVICASHNGESSVGDTIASVLPQCDIYIVDDASTDDTTAIAHDAGAHVLRLSRNVGKARAIRRMLDKKLEHLGDKRIPECYEYVLILDDDTIIDDTHIQTMEEMMDENPQLAAGRVCWKVNGETISTGMVLLLHVLLQVGMCSS